MCSTNKTLRCVYAFTAIMPITLTRILLNSLRRELPADKHFERFFSILSVYICSRTADEIARSELQQHALIVNHYIAIRKTKKSER